MRNDIWFSGRTPSSQQYATCRNSLRVFFELRQSGKVTLERLALKTRLIHNLRTSFHLVKKLFCIVSFIFVYYSFFYFLFSPPYYSIGVFWINWQKSFITFSPLLVHTKFLLSFNMYSKYFFILEIHKMITYHFFFRRKKGLC